MFLNTLLRLPLPVVLALCAALLVLAVLARVVAGLRRPAVVKAPKPARVEAGPR
jgi:heme A synthase